MSDAVDVKLRGKIFKNSWQSAGFIASILMGQAFNVTPFGSVSLYQLK
jgi:hypothetical protein